MFRGHWVLNGGCCLLFAILYLIMSCPFLPLLASSSFTFFGLWRRRKFCGFVILSSRYRISFASVGGWVCQAWSPLRLCCHIDTAAIFGLLGSQILGIHSSRYFCLVSCLCTHLLAF